MPRKVTKLSVEWRERIKTSGILERVMEHAKGDTEMTQTQLKAAEICLSRAFPVLKAIDHTSGGDKIKSSTFTLVLAEKKRGKKQVRPL